jgi:aminotransferase EvaB
MIVRYNYLNNEFKDTKNIFKDWKKLIKKTDFTLGSYVNRFEKRFANFIKIKNCIAVNTGTDALTLCLKALNIKNGDEVITTANTFYATVGAIIAVGAKPVLVDSDDRFQIDAYKIEKRITSKTKAVIAVHWGGGSPDIKKILKICQKYKIEVIEDACMGIGSKIKKKFVGTFGRINAVSMHPLKSLNVMGDGGAVLTNDDKLARWLRIYRNHGMINRNKIVMWGENRRMQPLQSIVALHGLKKLNQIIAKRNLNAKLLDTHLGKLHQNIIIPKRISGNIENFSLYMALFNNRDELIKYLNKNGVQATIHYPVPLHLQKPGKLLGYKMGDFPNSEFQAKKLLTLPVHQFLTRKDLLKIVNLINKFYAK